MNEQRLRLLDLFCGAGGAAMGYHRAGFEVVGVDIKPQPNYPFEFIQADALDFPLDGFDAIHASPPCQGYSVANNIHGRVHPMLIGRVREALIASGVPYVIENVEGARGEMKNPITLCGLTFGLGVKRHRLFECNFPVLTLPCPPGHPGDWVMVFGGTVLERSPQIGRTLNNGPIFRRKHLGVERGREAMGIDWMNRNELSEAIPPAYTEHIGHYLMAAIDREIRDKEAA
jgi:DNA (cytosine-5)-methyltransferase 1